ncbi:MAG: hypothetical protein K0U64_01705, partial [Actinomycetia bacterium]|nr:hypothetical protein [Actinomycetes bacterium]
MNRFARVMRCWPMYVSAAILLLTPLLLAGCSAETTTGEGNAEVGTQGYVEGDGTLTLLPPEERQ